MRAHTKAHAYKKIFTDEFDPAYAPGRKRKSGSQKNHDGIIDRDEAEKHIQGRDRKRVKAGDDDADGGQRHQRPRDHRECDS